MYYDDDDDDDDEGDHVHVQQDVQPNPPIGRVRFPNRRYYNNEMIN